MLKRGEYRKAIFCIVYAKDKEKIEYLLFKRKLHWKGWEFCKGGCESGENLKTCVAREVKEESGLKSIKIKKYSKKGKYLYSNKLEDRPGIIGQTYTLFSCEVNKGKVKLDKKSQEHSDYKWVSFDKALKILTWPNQRACLRVVNSSI